MTGQPLGQAPRGPRPVREKQGNQKPRDRKAGEKWNRTRTGIPGQTRLKPGVPRPKRGPAPGAVQGWRRL